MVMAYSGRVQSGPLNSSSTRRPKPSTAHCATQSRQPATRSRQKSREYTSLSEREESISISSATTSPSSTTGLVVNEVQGDLFSCPDTASLAHCVSADMRMGRGIAKLFKTKFNGVANLKAQGVKTGGVAVLQRDKRFIYYLVTKPLYFHKPTPETLRSSLQKMKEHCVKNDVKELCMPMIGCGLDLLAWDSVKPMIIEAFDGVNISITVYYL